jgi:hypothetical protein
LLLGTKKIEQNYQENPLRFFIPSKSRRRNQSLAIRAPSIKKRVILQVYHPDNISDMKKLHHWEGLTEEEVVQATTPSKFLIQV